MVRWVDNIGHSLIANIKIFIGPFDEEEYEYRQCLICKKFYSIRRTKYKKLCNNCLHSSKNKKTKPLSINTNKTI